MQTVMAVELAIVIALMVYPLFRRERPLATQMVFPRQPPVAQGESVTILLLASDGSVRHEMHTSDPRMQQAFIAYGGLTYARTDREQDGALCYEQVA